MRKIRSLLTAVLLSSVFLSCEDDTTIINETLPPPIANAGNSITIQEPASTVTVTGSGTTSNGYITGYLWSLISGPNSPEILSPSSPSTEITNLINGSYLFQFAVIDSAGLTGVDTVSVRVVSASATTVTFQPNNSPTELVMVLATPEASDVASPELLAEAWTSGGPFNCRSIVKFDLSTIPANRTVVSAKLSLYSNPNPMNGNLQDANFGTANAMFISRVTESWNGSTLFSNTPSSDVSSRILIPHTNNAFQDIIDLDVTDLVSPMVTSDNFGFLMQLENEVIYNSRIYCSSRHADATKHPKLVVIYQ